MSQALSGNTPIKVEDLIRRMKTEMQREAQPVKRETHEADALERAFLQFYQANPETTFAVELPNQVQDMAYVEEPSNDLQPVISAATQESCTPIEIDQYQSQIGEEERLRSKLARTKQEIINSVKKRRAQSQERLKGSQLQDLASRIVSQCKVAIETASNIFLDCEQKEISTPVSTDSARRLYAEQHQKFKNDIHSGKSFS